LKDLTTKGFFIDQNGVNSKDLAKEAMKKKAQKSGVQPKKPQSAYMCYNQEIQKTIWAKNPEAKLTEVAKMIGEQWSQLKDNEKTKWVNLANKDKIRHEKELN
jgi:hypothetical protein